MAGIYFARKWTRLRVTRSEVDEITSYALDSRAVKIATWENVEAMVKSEVASLNLVQNSAFTPPISNLQLRINCKAVVVSVAGYIVSLASSVSGSRLSCQYLQSRQKLTKSRFLAGKKPYHLGKCTNKEHMKELRIRVLCIA